MLNAGENMKVITEDGYKEFLSEISQFTPDEIFWLAENLSSKLKEIDTLTVSQLRPMCDAPKNGKFLVVLNTEDAFHECSFLSDGRVKIGTVAIRVEYCIGWIPKPIYKPEKE